MLIMYNSVSFISVPRRQTDRACAASAMLSGVLRDIGLKTTIHDLVIDLSKNNFSSNLVENFALNLEDDYEKVIKYVEVYVQDIINQKPDLIALSVLSYHSHRWCMFILNYIKTHSDIPTVIGGPGVSIPMQEQAAVHRSVSIDTNNMFGKYCLENLLTDYYVNGEGEFALRDLCLGKDNIDGLNMGTPARLPSLEIRSFLTLLIGKNMI